jgi:DNA topoisomerase-1
MTGLRYISDQQPGITRVRVKDGFHYFGPEGKPLTDERTIARINALAIPPAYENVWICPDPYGHLQATGRDARGRKQYRYHQLWEQVRDADKYQQLYEFGRALPRIRRRVAKDTAMAALCQEKVIAVIVRLLDISLIRIGTREYARTNKSYGLTTLKRRHATVTPSRIRFRFTGKSGVAHDVTVKDARIARIVRQCMEIPGHQLFHYKDDSGSLHAVDSSAVNAYLKQAGGGEFTAKHYRTWAGSAHVLAALQRRPATDEAAAKLAIAQTVKEVARRLGNTPAICRSCYIYPAILDAYLKGGLPARSQAPGPRELNANERRLLEFLRQHLSP